MARKKDETEIGITGKPIPRRRLSPGNRYEFDLKLSEEYSKEFAEMQDEIYDLKAKLSRCQQPDNPQYTEEEMEAMTAEQHKEWSGLVPGSPEAVKEGCKCPVMDNEDMPDGRKWVNGDCPLHGKVQ